MSKQFASVADLEEKKATFARLSEHCWSYTAEGDPNTGVVIGDEAVLICDTLATPVMARRLIAEIRKVTDKPIKYAVLSHYHAVRVLGASAYRDEGLQEVIASQGTYEMIVERGAQDMQSEYERFPRLFQAFESIPGLTWPTLVFRDGISLWMGRDLEVRVFHPGAGHTRGDTVVWVPSEKVLFSGDLVEYDAACYTGDAQLADWPATLDALAALGAEKLVPGRGPALDTPDRVAAGLAYTRDFVSTLYASAREAHAQGMDLKRAMAHIRRAMDPKFAQVFIYEHCLPFDVVRAMDEAGGIRHPRIWTAERDREMWHGLQEGN
ncbi:MBL fold metallo-hydrolase [Castellaniella sp. WN]